VVRQEANIAHTYAHIWLLWVAIWLWFNRPIELSIFWSILVTIAFLYFLWEKQSTSQVVHNEIWAQLWLVWAIILVSQMSGYKADITSYLFGDILLLGNQDIYIILWIVWVCMLLFIFFWRKRYAISLHMGLAKSKNISVTTSYLIYLVGLGLLIWWAMKIIWVLLVSAFLILPSNIWKILANNKSHRNYISIAICFLISIIALFVSRHLDMPSWASIVWLMIICYLVIIIVKKLHKNIFRR
jgi:zinc transport system permease protein